MKILVLISTFLIINSFINKGICQRIDLPKYNPDHSDTAFFEIDPKWKDSLFEFETLPEFPGGEKAVIKYLSENTIYPESAIKDSITGLTTIFFIIDVDGSTKNFRIHKSIQNDIDSACIRAIREMPKWTPGSTVFRAKKGLYRTKVPFYYTVSFNFQLNNSINYKGIVIRPK